MMYNKKGTLSSFLTTCMTIKLPQNAEEITYCANEASDDLADEKEKTLLLPLVFIAY